VLSAFRASVAGNENVDLTYTRVGPAAFQVNYHGQMIRQINLAGHAFERRIGSLVKAQQVGL
jgi:hypothetical protein